MGETAIEWCSHVWNFVRGCRRVSEGCRNCYAERQAYRFSRKGGPYHGLVTMSLRGPRWTGDGLFVENKLADPLTLRAPKDGSRHRIFVNSMSDLFFEEFSNEQIAAGFGVMAACPQHDFLVLTKRPERAHSFLHWAMSAASNLGTAEFCSRFARDAVLERHTPWPLRNVWLGVSVEDQPTANKRIPNLLTCPAAVRFVSYEPALGAIDFRCIPANHDAAVGDMLDALSGCEYYDQDEPHGKLEPSNVAARGPRLDWVIVGGESGPGARPFDIAWARSVVTECEASGVAAFVKQLGAITVDSAFADRDGTPGLVLGIRNKKGGDPEEWPSNLRVRQFPEVRQ